MLLDATNADKAVLLSSGIPITEVVATRIRHKSLPRAISTHKPKNRQSALTRRPDRDSLRLSNGSAIPHTCPVKHRYFLRVTGGVRLLLRHVLMLLGMIALRL